MEQDRQLGISWERFTRYWSKLGPVGLFIAKQLKFQLPSLLILSLPRSGSSWVGATIGVSPNAIYLREPLNQGYRAHGYSGESVFEIESDALPTIYAQYAEYAFSGFPAFPEHVVFDRDQWSLLDRRSRRLVIKEINPLAVDWLIRLYQPRVLFLLRHPVDVALSYERLGWRQFLTVEGWKDFGDFQGRVHRFAFDVLRLHCDHKIAYYEELAKDPRSSFRDLYSFAEMTWSSEVESYVARTTSPSDVDRENSYSVCRNSREMVHTWRSDVNATAEVVEAIKNGYEAYDLPFYGAESDW